MLLPKCLVAAACAATLATTAFAAPYPRSTMPAAVDLGLAQGSGTNSQITVTVALKLRNPDQLQELLQKVYTPQSSQYRSFLSKDEFAAQFGPTAESVAQVTQHFQKAGFSVTRSSTAQLKVTGSIAAVQKEFAVQLHDYAVGASASTPEFRFRAPTATPAISVQIADSVQGAFGFNTRPSFRPNIKTGGPVRSAHRINPVKSSKAPATTDEPGVWTVQDFAEYYNVEPLYSKGISGSNQTIGIVTLASFTTSDAFAYWNSLNLKVNKNRIKVLQIDGGSGPPSDASGSDETTLDVEQSGGIAPGANLLVYEAPNTEQGFIDAFSSVVDQNTADTVSVSWGEWEWLDTIAVDDVIDPTNPHRTTTFLKALNDVLIQAALQGQSFFAAAGDAGAYDANDGASIFPYPQFSKTLSVDDPASQTYITAAGGTTLPGPQEYSLPDGSTFTVNIATEQAWTWDYLTQLCSILGFTPVTCGIFPVGGGGGVSSFVSLPLYQFLIPGIAVTPSGQDLVDVSNTPLPDGITLPVKLPSGFLGRNVPDISVNSDPDTGYTLWYTSDQTGFAVNDFFGGTSFAAPQLNGVTSLFDQGLHHRVGLLNFPVYNIVRFNAAYGGKNPPLRDIKAGDNWFWLGRPGYDQASGVGVPNVANLFEALQDPFF